MGWATMAIEKLKKGETVKIRPKGNSMKGKVESGDLVTVEPAGEREAKPGDIVLCKVRGAQYLHLVLAEKNGQWLIGNNRGGVNGWIGKSAIYGFAAKIEK